MGHGYSGVNHPVGKPIHYHTSQDLDQCAANDFGQGGIKGR